jgi:uracil-DNA glycosylase
MIPKPDSCIGCPLYKHGDYITPDTMVPGSKVLLIAQNPGPDEEAGHLLKNRYWRYGQSYDEWEQVVPQPLIGATGQLFNNKFLPQSGLHREEVSIANAIRCRPGNSLGLKADELPAITTAMKLETSKADIVAALRHCRDAHLHIPDSVDTIVTMGRHAMFSLTGIQNEEREYGKKQGVMESWRGYGCDVDDFSEFHTVDTSYYHPLTSDHRMFFTMHIAALFKGNNKRFYHATLNDFRKLGLMLQGKWPLPLPQWSTAAPTTWPRHAAFDTEYIPDDNTLIRWSLCDNKENLYCVESDGGYASGIPIQSGSTVVIQNALADISHLSRIVDVSDIRIEDMMLAHSVLWTGEPHSLNYIASMYGSLNRYKHLSSGSPQLYSALDAWEPNFMWKYHFIPQFKVDKQSWHVYRQYRMPQVHIINKAQLKGSAINSQRLEDVLLQTTKTLILAVEST